MAERQAGHAAAANEEEMAPQSLYCICLNVVKKMVPLSVKLLCDLPAPLVEDLAVVLSPCEVLDLEEVFHTKGLTPKAWEHLWKRFSRDIKVKVRKPSQRGSLETARHMWIRQYVSTKLLPVFLWWDPERPEENWPQMWEFMARDGVTEEQCSRLSPREFLRQVERLARLVAEVAVSFKVLLSISAFPQIIQALTTNLVELRLGWLSNRSASAILKVLKELTMNGHLKILYLMEPISLYVEWFLLFFVVSGMFQCRRCAQYFSACKKLAAEILAQSKVSCFCCSHSSSSSDMELGTDQRVWDHSYCVQWIEFWSNPEKANPKSHVYRSVSQNSKWKKASEFQRYITMCFCVRLSSGFLAILQDLGYAGLTDQDDDDRHESAHTNAAADPSSGDAEIGCVSHGGMDIDEELGLGDSEDCEDEAETLNTEMDVLLDEVLCLGCTSNWKWDWNKDNTPSDQRLLRTLSRIHQDEHHQSRGIERFIVRYQPWSICHESAASVNLLRGLAICLPSWNSLSCLCLDGVSRQSKHDADSDAENALDAMMDQVQKGNLKSLTLKCQQDDTIHVSLQRFFLRLFVALRRCDPNLQVMGKSLEPMELVKVTGGDNDEPLTFTLKEFANGRTETTIAHLHTSYSIDLAGGISRATVAEKNTTQDPFFRGVKCFKLKNLKFLGPGVFSPIMTLIKHNWKMRHLVLSDCHLGYTSISHVLTVLRGEEFRYLERIELDRTLNKPNRDLWQAVCRLLCRPQLSCLSLVHCGLTSKHINSAEFVEAVKKHGTHRKLALFLSHNEIGNRLWDFVLETVCPGSSLKILCFKYTYGNTQKGVETMQQIIRHCPDHLPLLKEAHFSYRSDDRHSVRLREVLGQISELVLEDLVPSPEHEYLAVM